MTLLFTNKGFYCKTLPSCAH